MNNSPEQDFNIYLNVYEIIELRITEETALSTTTGI